MNILFASSEVFPFAKTGGLADVAGALPLALKELGHDVRVIMPRYKTVDKHSQALKDLNKTISVPIGMETKNGKLFEGKLFESVPIYFLDQPQYFQRDFLYGQPNQEYPDNASRYIYFCRGVLETCKEIGFQPDIIHCNDWQTGLIPVYLKITYKNDGFFSRTGTVFTIHNLAYQGNFQPSDISLAHLPWDVYNMEGVEFYDKFSFLKSGLMYSDILTTVSKSYKDEICTPEHGFGMDGILRSRENNLFGILNGVDYTKWNPETNPWIKKNYGLENLEDKQECRKDLINELGLKVSASTPIICFVSRLSYQKGFELLKEGMQQIMKQGFAFVGIGAGQIEYQDYFQNLPKQFPGRCATFVGYKESLAHKTLAGSDMLLLPSQFEPCGLTQLYALKYGSVPIVRSVGGLKDTIQNFSSFSKKGTGFKFHGFATTHMDRSIKRARDVFMEQPVWKQLIVNGMKKDYGWNRSAREYQKLYNDILERKNYEYGYSIILNKNASSITCAA